MTKDRFTQRDYYTRCQTCGASFDMRDLAQVRKHLHGKTYKAERGQKPPLPNTGRRGDRDVLRATDISFPANIWFSILNRIFHLPRAVTALSKKATLFEWARPRRISSAPARASIASN